MKSFPNAFRIATWLMALVLSSFAIVTIFAETFSPKAQYLSQDLTLPAPVSSGGLAARAGSAAVLRGDLLADVAMARAAPALKPGKALDFEQTKTEREHAVASARDSLAFAPHSSTMWLLLATLQDQGPLRDSEAEALKMSYLTAPADANLIPARLAIVSRSPAISDVELKNLARGDIRLILTRRTDLKPVIISAYRRGSADGKAYINEIVRSIDPGFAASLR